MKKIVTLLLSACMTLCVGIGLTACGNSGLGNDGQNCEHSYSESITNPTCTERGYTTHTCTHCGDSFVDNYVDATHNYGTWIEEIAQDCETDGTFRFSHCS